MALHLIKDTRVRTTVRIRTDYIFPPIPVRSFDWSAVDDETYDGEGSLIGHGATEAAAIEDLLDQMEDL